MKHPPSPTLELRARLAAIAEKLGSSGPPDRDGLRQEILTIARETEALIEELEAVREEIRPLAERYRQIFPARPPSGETARIDHLGASTHRDRGWSALASGEPDRARGELERALERAPGDAGTLVLLAWALLEMGDVAGAGDRLATAREADPDHPLGQVVQGMLLLRQGAVEEAADILARAVASGTDRTAGMYGYLYLGIAREERGRPRDAQACFRRALELGPNLTEAYWQLGRSHHREGRHPLAIEAWKAGAQNRFSPWGARCGEEIEGLGGGSSPG